MLRRTVGGQAKQSQHITGKAIDVAFPDVPLKQMRYSALIRERGGVGYYPTSGIPFVHVDTGPVRAWPRMPRYELALLFPNGHTKHRPATAIRSRKDDVRRAQSATRRLATEVATFFDIHNHPRPADRRSRGGRLAAWPRAPRPQPAASLASSPRSPRSRRLKRCPALTRARRRPAGPDAARARQVARVASTPRRTRTALVSRPTATADASDHASAETADRSHELAGPAADEPPPAARPKPASPASSAASATAPRAGRRKRAQTLRASPRSSRAPGPRRSPPTARRRDRLR